MSSNNEAVKVRDGLASAALAVQSVVRTYRGTERWHNRWQEVKA
jgi:hypothetical protein